MSYIIFHKSNVPSIPQQVIIFYLNKFLYLTFMIIITWSCLIHK